MKVSCQVFNNIFMRWQYRKGLYFIPNEPYEKFKEWRKEQTAYHARTIAPYFKWSSKGRGKIAWVDNELVIIKGVSYVKDID